MSKEKNNSVASNKKGGSGKGKKNLKKISSKNPKSVVDKRARKIAIDRKSELTIHGRDGRIQDKERFEMNSFNRDKNI